MHLIDGDIQYILPLVNAVTGETGLPGVRAGKSAQEVVSGCARVGNNP